MKIKRIHKEEEKIGLGKKILWFIGALMPVIVMLLWMTVVVVAGAAFTVSSEIETGDQELHILALVIYAGFLLIFCWWYKKYCWNNGKDEWKQALQRKNIAGCLVFGFLFQIGVVALLDVILPAFPKLYDTYSPVFGVSVWVIICMCLLAPVVEEIIFRGLVLPKMERAVPWQCAVVIQAVLFGIYQITLVQGIFMAIVGVVLGYLAHRYKSIVPGILLHFALNCAGYISEIFIRGILRESTILSAIFALIMIVASVGFLYLVLGNMEKQEDKVTHKN